MGTGESHQSQRTDVPYFNDFHPSLGTWGPSPRGVVWIARQSRSFSDKIGHISLLLDLGGKSQYLPSDPTIPVVFSGIQVHLGLQQVKQKNRRFTRQAQLIFTQWPRIDKEGRQEEFQVATKCRQIMRLDGKLDPLCEWESLEKCGLDWWLRLEPYLHAQFHEYVKKQRASSSLTALDKVEVARTILAAKDEAKIEIESQSKRKSKVRRVSKGDQNRTTSLEKAAHWATGFDPVKDEGENGCDNDSTLTHQLLWDSAINSHTFARYLVEKAFSREWPSDFATCEAEYGKQFVDTFHVMYDLQK